MIGTRINNYEIVSLIGEGGLGNVYLARHPLIDILDVGSVPGSERP